MAHPDPEIRKIYGKIYKENQDAFERVEKFHGANRNFAVLVRESAGIPKPSEAVQP